MRGEATKRSDGDEDEISYPNNRGDDEVAIDIEVGAEKASYDSDC